MNKDIVIVSVARTPVGSFMGSLSEISATELASIAIKGALNKINLNPKEIDEVYLGCALQGGLGQAPATQASLGAGIPNSVPATTINKVCASGMKATIFATQSIMAGYNEVVMVAGTENMSKVPHYLFKGRNGQKLGNINLVDGMVMDGLINVYDQQHMGICAEECAKEYHYTREQQDEYAIQSYKKLAKAWQEGKFADEIIPVSVPQKKGEPILVTEDEDYKKVNFEKIPKLMPAFLKGGTVTAANASNINDGASALILMSIEKAKQLNLAPLARIISYADAALEPEKFTIAPSLAVKKALIKCNLTIDDIDFFEFHEAFSVVGMVNADLLKIDRKKLNVNGGAVALGHPLGNSGSRILVSLLSVLNQNNGKYGVAAVCNGGGGASAIIIEKI